MVCCNTAGYLLEIACSVIGGLLLLLLLIAFAVHRCVMTSELYAYGTRVKTVKSNATGPILSPDDNANCL